VFPLPVVGSAIDDFGAVFRLGQCWQQAAAAKMAMMAMTPVVQSA